MEKISILKSGLFESRFEFEKTSDANKQSPGKKGICFHSRLTAFFLRLFNKSPVKLEVSLNGATTPIYINRGSLTRWLNEHHAHNVNNINSWSQKEWGKAIQEVLDRIPNPDQRMQAPQGQTDTQTPLTSDQPKNTKTISGDAPSDPLGGHVTAKQPIQATSTPPQAQERSLNNQYKPQAPPPSAGEAAKPQTPLSTTPAAPPNIPKRRLIIDPKTLFKQKAESSSFLFLRQRSGKSLCINGVSKDMTIKNFLALVAAKLRIPQTEFCIVYAGKKLMDQREDGSDVTLGEYEYPRINMMHLITNTSPRDENLVTALNSFMQSKHRRDSTEYPYESFDLLKVTAWSLVDRIFRGRVDDVSSYQPVKDAHETIIQSIESSSEPNKEGLKQLVNESKQMLETAYNLYTQALNHIKTALHVKFDTQLNTDIAAIPLAPCQATNSTPNTFTILIEISEQDVRSIKVDKDRLNNWDCFPYFVGLFRMNPQESETIFNGLNEDCFKLLDTFFRKGTLKNEMQTSSEIDLISVYEFAKGMLVLRLKLEVVQEISDRLTAGSWTNNDYLNYYRDEDDSLGSLIKAFYSETDDLRQS